MFRELGTAGVIAIAIIGVLLSGSPAAASDPPQADPKVKEQAKRLVRELEMPIGGPGRVGPVTDRVDLLRTICTYSPGPRSSVKWLGVPRFSDTLIDRYAKKGQPAPSERKKDAERGQTEDCVAGWNATHGSRDLSEAGQNAVIASIEASSPVVTFVKPAKGMEGGYQTWAVKATIKYPFVSKGKVARSSTCVSATLQTWTAGDEIGSGGMITAIEEGTCRK